MKILGEFVRHGDLIERRFTASERKMIGNLARGLIESMAAADDPALYDDPVVRRRRPAPSPAPPDAAAECADAPRDRLADSKAAGARRVAADLEHAPGGMVSLDQQSAVEWMKALGDLRLALAARVGIDTLQRGGVTNPPGLLYAWLTSLHGSLTDAVHCALA